MVLASLVLATSWFVGYGALLGAVSLCVVFVLLGWRDGWFWIVCGLVLLLLVLFWMIAWNLLVVIPVFYFICGFGCCA